MSLYAIGDLQGCLANLRSLLRRIDYDRDKDLLWFTGDLVNRGPDSLGALRFVKSLGDGARCVLGNHDIYLLMVCHGLADAPGDGSFDDILAAPDRDELVDWLRRLELFAEAPERGLAMVHAGLAPSWSLDDARALAGEVEKELAADGGCREFLKRAYKPERLGPLGDERDDYDRRLCATLNVMTRIRYCTADERVDFEHTGPPGSQAAELSPWFEHPNRRAADTRLVFGHWSALGFMRRDDVICLDSGCVWGRHLTAYRLDENDEKRFEEPCFVRARQDAPTATASKSL